MTNEKIKTAVIARVLFGVLDSKKYIELLEVLAIEPEEINLGRFKDILDQFKISLDSFLHHTNRVLETEF